MRHEKDRGGGCVEGVDEQAELNRRFAVEVLGWTHCEMACGCGGWFSPRPHYHSPDGRLVSEDDIPECIRSLDAAWPSQETMRRHGWGEIEVSSFDDGGGESAVFGLDGRLLASKTADVYPAEALVRACLEAVKP